MDVTWDDPVADRFGLANHKNLLKSDEAFQKAASPHYDWEAYYVCNSKTYDNWFWESVRSPMKCLDGIWYYVTFDDFANTGKLYSHSFETGKSTEVDTVGRWMSSSGGYYLGAYSGLDVFDGELYFNSAKKICAYSPKTDAVRTVLEPDSTRNVYGMRINDYTLYYAMNKDISNVNPGAEQVIYSHVLAKAPVQGDMDDNGVLTANDALVLLEHAARIRLIPDKKIKYADMNGDGFITAADALMILRKAANM